MAVEGIEYGLVGGAESWVVMSAGVEAVAMCIGHYDSDCVSEGTNVDMRFAATALFRDYWVLIPVRAALKKYSCPAVAKRALKWGCISHIILPAATFCAL